MPALPTKAIIAVAGYGTRRLPIAKAVEKCMMPLLNRPIVDYVVQDAIKDIYFVVSGDALQLRHYYQRDVELEEYLSAKGKSDMIADITPPTGVAFHFVQQDRTGLYGTSIPIWLCQQFIADDEPFYSIFGDQTQYRLDGESELARLARCVQASGADGGMVGATVADDEVSKYGIIQMNQDGHFVQIVEKPLLADAPSRLANAGMFLLPGSFMARLDTQIRSPHSGEYYMTDIVNECIAGGQTFCVSATDAAYLDAGTVEGWVAANQWLLKATSL